MSSSSSFSSLLLTALASAMMLSSGCDSAPVERDVSEGERIFTSPVDDGNTFRCSTCHDVDEPGEDGLRRVGHPLADAAHRPTYKNGELTEMRDAVNTCLQEWMNAEPWTEDDVRWVALEQFLEEQAPQGPAEPLSIEIVAPPFSGDLGGGDPAAGRELFNRSCSSCHGSDGAGTELAPPVGGRGLEADYVAERVRRSGRTDSAVYDGLTGGVMPFWSADRLSDDELRDLTAWLGQGGEPPSDPGPSEPDPPDPSEPDPSGCASTHPLVGATAVLEENFHDVGGIAQVIDDCTIELRDFTFDGTGIDVRLYGGLDDNYDEGFAMGENLLRVGGWNGETLRFTLPPDRTLDDLDGVSVWCVPVGVDFGSGRFQ